MSGRTSSSLSPIGMSAAGGWDASRGAIVAAVLIGVVSLLTSGLLPILLGGLAEEHRLSASGLGVAATLEALAMAFAMGLSAAYLPARRLRLIAVASSIFLFAANVAVPICRSELAVILVRGLSGLPEGLLCWIAIGMITRTATPERWSGLMFTILTLTQLALSAAMTWWVLPTLGMNGGFAVIGALSLAGLAIAPMLPSHYPPLPQTADQGGRLPLGGWIALLGVLLYVSAASAVSIYLVPLALQAGLSSRVAQTAVSFALAAQALGAVLATALAGRVRYFSVLVAGVAIYTISFMAYVVAAPAWLFVLATAVAGGLTIFVIPFLIPMMIEIDPTRRAAMQSATVQLFGPALGPLLASGVVGTRDSQGAVWVAIALLVAGLGVIAALRRAGRRATTLAV